MDYFEIKKMDKITYFILLIAAACICIISVISLTSDEMLILEIVYKISLTCIVIYFICIFFLSIRKLSNNNNSFVDKLLLFIIGIIPLFLDYLISNNNSGFTGLTALMLITLVYWNLIVSFPKGLLYPVFLLLISTIYSWMFYNNPSPFSLSSNFSLLKFENIIFLMLGIILIILYTLIRTKWMLDTKELVGHRIASAKLANANVKLQDYAAKIATMSVAEERARMAREIHDILAHTLTSIMVQIGACEKLVKINPEKTINELNSIRETISESLLEIRKSLKVLREPLLDKGIEAWKKLVKTFADVTGMEIVLNVEDNFEITNEDLNELIYRILQESITNAYRHGHAKKVDIRIWYDSNKGLLLMRISDNGHGVENMTEGLGLKGMRERVKRLGGTIAWRSVAGYGFDLGIDIPVKGG